jgi:protein SCO1
MRCEHFVPHFSFMHIRSLKALPFFLLVTLTACNFKPATKEASAGAQKYELKGKVVSADKANSKVTIAHEEIKGYMEAMTMPFTLTEDWIYSELTPGAQIQATLVVDKGMTWLENPTVTKVSDPIAGRSEESNIEPKVGDEVPDFKLTNQDGKRISLKQLRSQSVVLTFIYTRCPLPDYCPLMTTNLQAIQKAAPNTQLLSVTIDPAYDTPKVLRDYALRMNAQHNFKQWNYATGSADEIKQIAAYFGLNYWPENDQIIHGLRTALINAEGKIIKTWRGNDWKPEEIIQALAKPLS